MKPTILLILLLAFGTQCPGQTNKLFLTVPSWGYFAYVPDTMHENVPDTMEQAETSTEAQPEESDPVGNWGEMTNGVRLSIRFTTNVFLSGAPIMAHMILRNLSDSPRGYWDDTQARGFQSSAVAYEIKSGGQILTNWWHPDRASPIVGVLPARTQAKFNDQLDHYFDLRSPGKYEVRAMVRCGFLQGSHLRADLFEVKSDATTIEILSAPSKPASDTMNGRPLKP